MSKPRGFTIVELLIVIVVVAILATISVIAYNGIQARAKNAKTVNAAVAWVRLLKLYNADKDSWPTNYSCLGSSTTYAATSGQCWEAVQWIVKPAFLTEMQPYISANYPEPDATNVAAGTATSPRGGLLYNTDNSTYWRLYVFQLGTGTCPDVGLQVYQGPNNIGMGYFCVYRLV